MASDRQERANPRLVYLNRPQAVWIPDQRMKDATRCPFCGTPYSERSWKCDRLPCLQVSYRLKVILNLVRIPFPMSTL